MPRLPAECTDDDDDGSDHHGVDGDDELLPHAQPAEAVPCSPAGLHCIAVGWCLTRGPGELCSQAPLLAPHISSQSLVLTTS